MRLPQARSIVVGWFSALSACGPTGAPGSDPADGAADSASSAADSASAVDGARPRLPAVMPRRRARTEATSWKAAIASTTSQSTTTSRRDLKWSSRTRRSPSRWKIHTPPQRRCSVRFFSGKSSSAARAPSLVALATVLKAEVRIRGRQSPCHLAPAPIKIKGDTDDVHGGRGIARCNSAGVAEVDPVYGLNPQVTTRKPPSYLDAMFSEELFWDGRAKSKFIDPVTSAVAIETGGALESQAAGPPVSDVEMSCQGYQWTDIEKKLATAKPLELATDVPAAMATVLAEHPTYPDLFAWAYGTPEITSRKIIFAIATHERQLTSYGTPWDRYNAGDMAALSKDQQRGLALFNTKAGCQKCHVPPLFTDGKFHNVGFQDRTLDPGRSIITGAAEDLGKMKTPGLRNVGLRAGGGLMHNGTFHGASLDAVVTSYNKGGFETEGIDPEIDQLDLSDEEFGKLLDFLQNGLTDKRVADAVPPFDHPKLSSQR